MLLMTGGSVTLAHTHQAATTPSPSMISQDPFHVPTLRTQTRPTSSSTPCLPALTFCVLPRLTAISCSPWAKPQSLLHASLCLAPLPTLRKWDAHTGSQAGMVRQGCSWPACLTQVWGVQVLQGSWSSTSPPNPIPYLSRGTAGGCGASYGESTGEGGARAETELPKAPPYPGHCAHPILQQHSLPPTWLEAEPSTNWSFVSCWPCSKIISA